MGVKDNGLGVSKNVTDNDALVSVIVTGSDAGIACRLTCFDLKSCLQWSKGCGPAKSDGCWENARLWQRELPFEINADTAYADDVSYRKQRRH